MKAIARTIRITPKKANLIAGMVRTKPVDEALKILKYLPKKAGVIIHKVIHSAAHNAVHNLKQDITTLFVKEIIVNKGPTLKRSVSVSRGRAHPILKRTAHITVLLGISEQPVKAETSTEVKEAPAKKATKKTTTKKSAA